MPYPPKPPAMEYICPRSETHQLQTEPEAPLWQGEIRVDSILSSSFCHPSLLWRGGSLAGIVIVLIKFTWCSGASPGVACKHLTDCNWSEGDLGRIGFCAIALPCTVHHYAALWMQEGMPSTACRTFLDTILWKVRPREGPPFCHASSF